jgi:glycosyltransferase involved in cell wall biosynthesis
MPYPVSVAPSARASRAAFDLPEDRFLFLVSYDMLSVQERKNPLGAIEAFHRAFPRDDRAGLVVKVNHGSHAPDEMARLRDALGRCQGAMLVDRTMSHQQAIDLHAVCDAYLSLHRSEGFGLNIAEAMLLGKPVVATGWSGNADFMTAGNSCPVNYHLVRLEQDFGPYRQGHHWADPDLDHAAYYMRRLVDDDAFRREIGERASATIAAEYSFEAVGRRYRQRLAVIDRYRSGGPVLRRPR